MSEKVLDLNIWEISYKKICGKREKCTRICDYCDLEAKFVMSNKYAIWELCTIHILERLKENKSRKKALAKFLEYLGPIETLEHEE